MRGEHGKKLKRRARSVLKIKRLLLDVNTTSLSNSITHSRRVHQCSTVTPKHHTTKSVRKVTSPTQQSSHQTARRPGSMQERQTGDHVVADD